MSDPSPSSSTYVLPIQSGLLRGPVLAWPTTLSLDPTIDYLTNPSDPLPRRLPRLLLSPKPKSTASKPRKRFVGTSAPSSSSSSASRRPVRVPLNQIPLEILEDEELNEAIRLLPSNYNFEVRPLLPVLLRLLPLLGRRGLRGIRG